jgi:hypothetical protein
LQLGQTRRLLLHVFEDDRQDLRFGHLTQHLGFNLQALDVLLVSNMAARFLFRLGHDASTLKQILYFAVFPRR